MKFEAVMGVNNYWILVEFATSIFRVQLVQTLKYSDPQIKANGFYEVFVTTF